MKKAGADTKSISNEVQLSAQERAKIRHDDINSKLNVVKEYVRSGRRVAVEPKIETPVV